MAGKKIETEEQFTKLLTNDLFLLFKHSLTCPVSGAAFDEYQSFITDKHDLETAFLAVQEARPLSNYVAETFGIKHASPQAILFKNGQPIWNDSHWRITQDSLQAALEQ